MSIADAYEWLNHVRVSLTRLDETTQLAEERNASRELVWLRDAHALLEATLEETPSLAERVRALPELESAREEHAQRMQERWVDAIERLQAGIAFHVSSRAPVMEALFPKQKLSLLRKAPQEAVARYMAEFDKRLHGTYVQRMFASDEYAFVGPVLAAVTEAADRLAEAKAPTLAAGEEAEGLRTELLAAAARCELAWRRARLLAEAALMPWDGAFEASGLGAKPRRRAARVHAEQEPSVEAH